MRTVLVAGMLLLIGSSAFADVVTLTTPTAGDATYSWNSKYGPSGYGAGGTTMGVNLYPGGGYGNDYTVSIFEIPIAALAGQTVTGATLQVNCLGFDTNYYYGSANIGWLDVGAITVTGDVVADGLGPASTGRPGGLAIWNSDWGTNSAGVRTFDVLTYVLADLAAGRAYCTFVMSGSRETYGSIYTAEGGSGPQIVATTVPEPATMGLLGLGLASLAMRRRKK